MTCWFFGCVGPRSGHHIYEEGSSVGVTVAAGLRAGDLDMRLVPPGLDGGADRQPQGHAALTHLRGVSHVVTVLAWWDRTGDRRTNSNSALIVDRECSAEEMIAEGCRAFPAIMARQPARIVVV